ncbi:LytTR family transcriptional regulator DNA-binding domain-containing protein [Companilactobacillus bobalius]|uniref:Heme-containing CO-sensing transcriptional regulator RcoM n=2 Tax=Companilactobacillus bobalius TaxID=2801451 RepID=A0A202FAR7_9LACO|nr:LytTR family transcriptional regulator DNA-binding domain-containing protein [Companilactobacillus bobalius]KAE9562510.1 hypothetical protein ATN92_04270 [Companilactobacillus bobalius]KRK81501.1 ABC transporter ATP-binding protein [Companilactobacillus bobalius DSM 19674]OVE97574.1 Heme-containing CO-sensing transcriptional regulator RcoM [Companilactobacillus bobalius]GEO57815.1 ABC transporter ATP-binding protein [Companilactobacillus paralimentarius]
MNLIEFKDVAKQNKNQSIFNNLSLKINSQENIGLKMSHTEINTFFDLLEQNTLPNSGSITNHAQSTSIKRHNDGIYQKITVKSYLQFFNQIAAQHVDIRKLAPQFSLGDNLAMKTNTLTTDQIERLHLFRIALSQPDLVFIESPLRDLSNEGIKSYLKALKVVRQKSTVVVISSYMEELLQLSSTIYQCVDHQLEKIDLELDKDSTKPQNIFRLSSHLDDKTIFFSPNEIDFIESINGVSNFSVNSEYFPSSLTMEELEKKLVHFGFFRCHRSYLVNLQRISELISYSKNSYTLILKNSKETLPLSRAKLDQLKDLLQ